MKNKIFDQITMIITFKIRGNKLRGKNVYSSPPYFQCKTITNKLKKAFLKFKVIKIIVNMT